MVWAGSDTGLIHLTRDGGKTWQNVTPPALAAWSKISQIEASHFDPAEAWAAVDRHRLEDYRPYVYRTRDYGRTWKQVAEGLSEPAYMNSVKEDPRRRGLLYGATELGVAVSMDGGDHWQPLQRNLPAVSVRDLVVHGDDLAIATFGRGFWILDGITPLRQMDEKTAASEAVLFQPANAIRLNPETFSGTPIPPEEPQAKNPPEGAILDYYLKAAGEATLEIVDAKGDVVRRFDSKEGAPARRRPAAIADAWFTPPPRLTAKAGANRMVWDLRYTPPGGDGDEDLGAPVRGPLVMPGTYTVRLNTGGRSYTQPLRVTLDPRSTATPAELQKQFELSMSIWKDMGRAREAARDGEAARIRSGLTRVNGQLGTALVVAQSADRTPPATAYDLARRAKAELETLLAEWKAKAK
jgi:hypothetical protein